MAMSPSSAPPGRPRSPPFPLAIAGGGRRAKPGRRRGLPLPLLSSGGGRSWRRIWRSPRRRLPLAEPDQAAWRAAAAAALVSRCLAEGSLPSDRGVLPPHPSMWPWPIWRRRFLAMREAAASRRLSACRPFCSEALCKLIDLVRPSLASGSSVVSSGPMGLVYLLWW